MPIYMVDRVMPGVTPEHLDTIRRTAEEACRAVTASGRSIRYLRSVFTPGESHCRCLFEAPDGDLVREVNDFAELPHSRIVLAMELAAQITRTKEQ